MRSIIFHRKGGKAKEDIHTQYFTLQGRKYNNVQNLKVYSHPLVFFPENLNLPPLISSFSPVLSLSLSTFLILQAYFVSQLVYIYSIQHARKSSRRINILRHLFISAVCEPHTQLLTFSADLQVNVNNLCQRYRGGKKWHIHCKMILFKHQYPITYP